MWMFLRCDVGASSWCSSVWSYLLHMHLRRPSWLKRLQPVRLISVPCTRYSPNHICLPSICSLKVCMICWKCNHTIHSLSMKIDNTGHVAYYRKSRNCCTYFDGQLASQVDCFDECRCPCCKPSKSCIATLSLHMYCCESDHTVGERRSHGPQALPLAVKTDLSRTQHGMMKTRHLQVAFQNQWISPRATPACSGTQDDNVLTVATKLMGTIHMLKHLH